MCEAFFSFVLGWKASRETKKPRLYSFYILTSFYEESGFIHIGEQLEIYSTPPMLSWLSLAILNATIPVKQATVVI